MKKRLLSMFLALAMVITLLPGYIAPTRGVDATIHRGSADIFSVEAGHTFKGWTPALPETMPAGISLIHAEFRPVSGTADYTHCKSAAYSDLDLTAWYHDATDFVLENELMNGTGETTFAPDAPLTRAMLVTILWRMAGEPVVNYLIPFTDVSADMWYTEAIRWAESEKIVKGYSATTFGTDELITREQLAAILYRYEQSKGGGFTGMWMFLLDFSDRADVSEWAYEAMCYMTMKGVILGKQNDVLAPKAYATRAETAQIIKNYLNLQNH